MPNSLSATGIQAGRSIEVLHGRELLTELGYTGP